MVDPIAEVKQQVLAAGTQKIKAKYQLPSTVKMEDSVHLSSDIMRVRADKFSAGRMEKIKDIRDQLNAGTYVTSEKLDRSLDRALDDIAFDRAIDSAIARLF